MIREISLQKLGNEISRIIEAMENMPKDKGMLMFSKINIKDGLCCLVVQLGQHMNFSYVRTNKKGNRNRLVLPKAQQMGWRESPILFCAANETARDVAENDIQQPP